MRYLMGAIAIAPFAVLLLSMGTGHARVRGCCAPASPFEAGSKTAGCETPRPDVRLSPELGATCRSSDETTALRIPADGA